MSDVIDQDHHALVESTTNLVIDNDEAESSKNSHPQAMTNITSTSPPPPPASSEASTYIGNTTVDSSINTELRNSKSYNTINESKSINDDLVQNKILSSNPTVPTIPSITTDNTFVSEPFAESLSTSPMSPTTQPIPHESFKSHSATSSTSTLTPEDQERISTKEKNLDEIKRQCSCLIHELEGNDQPEVIIKRHIQQLKKYNELKDVALQLVTLIADQRQVKTTDILNEMKLEVGEEGNEI
ncbi:Swi5 family protein [Candida parapsilosis]|uniref:Swi5-domain-containing protein n=2 Tax=Candida parapsilosis TaxID=5480 RepID=G8BD60_CANPC|nr:uncharacterized protein CPAR2_208500 [Candida parapsilosis]KAF6054644.1 Swi5 family protein [Candida parapsilosis]KAF6056330.1 Swi5 family protein [Candida parapsilosis]KAF6059263.1 Swi5 family protein [Candida parapsilosis]KAF6068020.1 Swi5 family protein [Candida parapsilosis]KAI5905286.1 hypothetical protein K4G60_g4545 [Candida parapsilosis]